MSTRLIALAMAAALLAGCQGTAGPTGSPAAPTAPGVSLSAAPAPSEGSGAASGAPVGSGEPASEQPLEVGPEPAFGTATFTVDASKAASVHYPADSGPAVVSAIDGSGATWTLTIPEGALERPATITMTPLTSVTSSDLPGPVLGGVLLEPEGTSFAVPATLSVTGGPTNGAAAVLTGDEDGLVRLAVPAGDTWGTVAVTHFSPWYSADPDDPQWSKAFSDQERDAKAAAEEARRLLKRKLNVPDAPSIPWKCRDDSDGSRSNGRCRSSTGLLWNRSTP